MIASKKVLPMCPKWTLMSQYVQSILVAIDAFTKYFPNVLLIICSLLDQCTRKIQENVWIEN